jgi:hypothetical protein
VADVVKPMARVGATAYARARLAWLESEEAKRCMAGPSDGVHLRNRLELAFAAGWNAATAASRQALEATVAELFGSGRIERGEKK